MEKCCSMKSRIFLTGAPGVGKTTAIINVLTSLKKSRPDSTVKGFFTRELRDGGDRVGFEVVTVDGRRGTLATSTSGSSSAQFPRVGKYSVHVPEFESLVLPELEIGHGEGPGLFVIDEVGKMELFSSDFYPAVCEILDSKTAKAVLGTIPVPKFGKQIAEVERILQRADVIVYTFTRKNRDDMTKTVLSYVQSVLSGEE